MTQWQPTLLIVDDEPDILDAVERLFRKDYRILTAQTPDVAFDTLSREDVQVCLSDQRMPTMPGVEFLAELRKSHPDIVRVLLTGYSNIEHVIDAINEGHVYRYVSKPWDPAEFKIIVSQCFDYWSARREREQLVTKLQHANTQLADQNRLLSEKNEELKTLDRMKNVFMEVVSHELNTPIAVILGYAFLLRREFSDNESVVVTKAVTGIESSGNRLKNISSRIFKMLAEDAPQALALEEIGLQDFFEHLHEQVQPFLKKRSQTLKAHVAPGAETVRADRAKLYDVFLNLLMNAIKFSYDGQAIEIAARPGEDENSVVTTVTDTGIGVSEEDRDQIFDAFFSTFESQYHSSGDFEFGKRGIGLGLSVAKRFTEMHGGRITVASTRGGGSTFAVNLPRDPADVSQGIAD